MTALGGIVLKKPPVAMAVQDRFVVPTCGATICRHWLLRKPEIARQWAADFSTQSVGKPTSSAGRAEDRPVPIPVVPGHLSVTRMQTRDQMPAIAAWNSAAGRLLPVYHIVYRGAPALARRGAAESGLSAGHRHTRGSRLMNRLQNKRALVTGGTSGIGLETARQFLAEGARVVITGSNTATLAAAKAELPNDVLVIRADAGDFADQGVIARTVREQLGGLDVLFVNAGRGDFRALEQWDEASFDRSVAVNLKGPFFLVQALLRASPVPRRLCSTPRSTGGSVCQTRASTPLPRPGSSRSRARCRAN
jgi:hypothetical protein